MSNKGYSSFIVTTLASVGELTRKHLTVTLVKVRWKEEPGPSEEATLPQWAQAQHLASHFGVSSGPHRAAVRWRTVPARRADRLASIAHTPGWELPALA